MVRTEPIKKKISEGNAKRLAVNFTDLVTRTSPKSEKHLRAILVPSLRAALKLQGASLSCLSDFDDQTVIFNSVIFSRSQVGVETCRRRMQEMRF